MIRDLQRNELSPVYWRHRFVPKDPMWASAAMLARVRAELKAYDSYLDIWWSTTRCAGWDVERPGRWRVVRFTDHWTHVFYWEGPNGEYREPLPVEPIMLKIRKADCDLKYLSADVDAKNEAADRKKRAEYLDWARRGILELHRKFLGRKVIPVACMPRKLA